jgi:hypothetical protein
MFYQHILFLTAPNQTVFIAGLAYLAHTFTMSPPLHVHVPTFQVQGQGHWQTLDFGFFFKIVDCVQILCILMIYACALLVELLLCF